VHLQYNERVWGNADAAAHIRTVCEACDAPVIATLHDIRKGYGWRGIGRRTWARRTASVPSLVTPTSSSAPSAGDRDRATGLWASLQRAGRYVWKEWQNTRATKHLARHAAQVLVCTREEARRLRGLAPADAVTVIPHYVEDRSLTISADDAKDAVDLPQRRVCTVLGFIHRAKGHALVVEAMRHWPDDVHVVFAGRPAMGSADFAHQLEQRAAQLKVANRLRITGYLDEKTLDRYLAATDLALCPFEELSASGSLATWIAAERPILASEQPQVAEYNAMAAGAIVTFTPYVPEALATTALAQLEGASEAGRAARAQLREKLSLSRIIQEHATVYRAAAAGKAPSTQSPTA
jgi:glycosyltransferase involved in cell wall biosynthesis